jgi:hypothetical protein
MGCEERLPGRLRAALWGRLDAVILQDRFDRVAGEVVPEMLQRAAEAGVAPRRILSRHARDEGREVRLGARAPRAPLLRAVVLLGNEQTVPAQNRVWRHDASHVGKPPSTERVAFYGQATALVVGEVNPVGTVRRTEDPILLAEVINDGLLLSIDPT